MSLPLPLKPGTFLGGQYSIEALINSGGFGAVYRGIDTNENDRPCAIKETYDVTPSARRQALMEASILFTLSSKHLPHVYDAFEANGRFYLVMQLIEGQNLQQLLHARGHAYSEQEVLAWFLPIMTVLQELHGRSSPVIHRDIKPANIILTPNDPYTSDFHAVLVDFGLTRLYDPQGNTQTQVRAVSEGFSPIEQYLGKTGPQSDIYSLAATMYVLLTNTLPPSAIARSGRDELIAPRKLNPTLSPKIEHVLLRGLAVNAEQRYQSMREFVQALKEHAFNAHAAPTVAFNGTPLAHKPTEVARQRPPINPYGNVQSMPSYPVSHPVYHSPVSVPPPGYAMMPQAALVRSQPLPSSLGQGCLWGLLQGVLAALLILFLKKEMYFYVATGVGFLFYLLAGFLTTHKGGKFSRGGWAGFWAGIVSTCMFWFVLLLGLVVLTAQRIQTDTSLAQGRKIPPLPRNEVGRAWQAVLPMLPTHFIALYKPVWVPLTIFLVGGLLLAIGFGWLGGFLGKFQGKTSVKARKRA